MLCIMYRMLSQSRNNVDKTMDKKERERIKQSKFVL